ncbi:MAG: FRG domain-containing protein [Mariniphaga sp.]|nr:FRG domain-containing protein [Mariniphaga sp.]
MKPLFVPHTFPIVNNKFSKNDNCKPNGLTGIIASDPMKVNTYSKMVDMISKLACLNRPYVLFFRGQIKEFRLGNQFPTIYPTYFRKYIQGTEIQNLMNILEIKQEELRDKNHNRKPRFHGAASIWELLHVRWALLQHYEICDTPFDITQSLHVAASFALQSEQGKREFRTGIIYVLALPWPSKNFHYNEEEELYLVRLAGKTPPQAKRPYRQEAYAAIITGVNPSVSSISFFNATFFLLSSL